MPIPVAQKSRHCDPAGKAAGKTVSLSVLAGSGAKVRKSRNGPRRAAVLIAVHILIIAHIIYWLATGRRETLSPVEPSESMYTLEQGLVNAGFIFFLAALLSTLLLGRFFCGWGCHVVALQDLCGWIMKKLGVHPRPFRTRLLPLATLILALYMFVWPTFKREVVKPAAGARWEALAPYLYEAAPRPVFKNALMKRDFWETFPPWYVAIPFFGVCGFACVYFLGAKGFCTYGCPYGGFFAPIDKAAPGRILVTDACEHCGHCTSVCTSNVRVHEEVRDYGMVIDPGCMKCMDCVSVCPNDALYFGFAKPALLTRPRVERPIRAVKPDLTWPEEIIGLVLLVTFGLFGFRSMLNNVPLLMSFGLSGVTTFLVWKLWRMARDPSVRLQSLQLKLKGRVRPAGFVFGALALVLAAAGAWGTFVNTHRYLGDVADAKIRIDAGAVFSPGYAPPPRDKELALRGLRHFTISGPRSLGGYGWELTADQYIRSAWMASVAGDFERAERLLRDGVRVASTTKHGPGEGLVSGLATIMHVRGATQDEVAGVFAELTRQYPAAGQIRLALAGMELARGRAPEAAAAAEAAAKSQPHDAALHAGAGRVVAQAGQLDRSLALLREAVVLEPHTASYRALLGEVLFASGRPDEGIAEIRRAAELEPRNLQFQHMLAEALRATGRTQEADEIQARIRRQTSQPPPSPPSPPHPPPALPSQPGR